LPGVDDKKFRDLLSNEFKVLVAGGFGNLKGKVFRIGSMGEVSKYHVIRTLSSVESALKILGLDVPSDSLNKALEKF
jgi:aspartate aminotransferase-like enzyme